MRVFGYLLIILPLFSSAAKYKIFEKDGYFGLKEELSGAVAIPAVHEELGWTNKEKKVFQEAIGFRRGEFWGLISVKNKRLSEARFYSLAPFDSVYIKAAVKKDFSNQLYYGLLDEKGKVRLRFNYFSLEAIGDHVLASDYRSKFASYGVLSRKGDILIPFNYRKIQLEGGVMMARAKRLDLFDTEGHLIQHGLDSVKVLPQGLIFYRDGMAGYAQGDTRAEIAFKEVLVDSAQFKTVEFPKWDIYNGKDLLFSWNADSLKKGPSESWIAFLNGSEHVFLPNASQTLSTSLQIREVKEDYILAKNLNDRLWYSIGEMGEMKFGGYDTLYASNHYFFAHQADGWKILNKDGVEINAFKVSALNEGVGDYFIAKKNGYWGLLDFAGQPFFEYKYDSIIPASESYVVNYLGSWGQVDLNGDWLITPYYEEVIAYHDVFVARRGKSYSYFHKGVETHKTVFAPLDTLGQFIIIDDGFDNLGLVDERGRILISPEFETVNRWSNYLELRGSDYAMFLKDDGQIVLDKEAGIQEIDGYGDLYFKVKKGNRWGFIDKQGRLRIANRYSQCKNFSEGMAAISLRGRWGFIDKSESLVVQPYYDQVYPFFKGYAIVGVDGKYGIIDMQGNEVVNIKWPSINPLRTENYTFQDDQGKVGLISSTGQVILQPNYDTIDDLEKYLVVSQFGIKGVLSGKGEEILPLVFKEVQESEGFLIVRK